MALYEKFWDCSSCGTEGISALRKLKCPNCGHTKSPQDQEHRSQVEIVDADGLALANDGPHWNCSSCGSVVLDKYTKCTECGNPREADDTSNRVIELGSTPPPVYKPKDSTQQWYEQPETETPQETHHTVSATTYPRYESRTTGSNEMGNWLSDLPWRNILIVVAVVSALLGLGWLIFHTTEVKAQVTGFSWSRDVAIERYQTVHESGWSQPIGAYNVRTERRIQSYDPIYETRTRNVHHSKTCYRDLGNGSEESYDCSTDSTETYQEKVGEKPIYATWYEYDLDTWRYERSAHAGANDRNPYWPEYSLNLKGQTVIGAERVGNTTETYNVLFRYPLNNPCVKTKKLFL